MESEYEGKLCDGHSRKWAGINWQPNCFPISWKPFSESKHRSSAKCYLKAFWRQHFVPAWLRCIALFYFPLILNNYFLQAPSCALTWGQNICEKFPFFTNHQYDKLLFAFSIFDLNKTCFTYLGENEKTHKNNNDDKCVSYVLHLLCLIKFTLHYIIIIIIIKFTWWFSLQVGFP